jgi:hypothetical protein
LTTDAGIERIDWMDTDTTAAPAEPFTQPLVTVDPRTFVRPQMRIMGDHGEALGTVGAIEHDAATDDLTSLTVRHGLLGRKHTYVTADLVHWVNEYSVVLQLSPVALKQLARAAK